MGIRCMRLTEQLLPRCMHVWFENSTTPKLVRAVAHPLHERVVQEWAASWHRALRRWRTSASALNSPPCRSPQCWSSRRHQTPPAPSAAWVQAIAAPCFQGIRSQCNRCRDLAQIQTKYSDGLRKMQLWGNCFCNLFASTRPQCCVGVFTHVRPRSTWQTLPTSEHLLAHIISNEQRVARRRGSRQRERP